MYQIKSNIKRTKIIFLSNNLIKQKPKHPLVINGNVYVISHSITRSYKIIIRLFGSDYK